MEIIEFNLSNIPEAKDIILCLGFFDGLHLGHQKIISKAVKDNNKVAVLTFDNPPGFILGKKETKASLASISDKAKILEKMSVSYLFVMTFDKKIMSLSKDDFINLVLKKISPKKIYCGDDYRFGKDGLGDVNYLSKFFDVDSTKIVNFNNKKISSTEIRHLIHEGKIKEANELLARAYRLVGKVVKGKQNGAKLGFPTANLELSFSYVIPSSGVYVGYANVDDKKYKCLISIGTHPSIDEVDSDIIEIYILDFSNDIYDKEIAIDFIDRIRDIQKFNTTTDLIKQINRDVEYVRNNY